MAQRIRTHDWGATPLGPQETWPQSLKSAVEICLASGFPNFIFWGPELIMLYNDAGSALLPDGQPNEATLHQGMKVRRGTKYVLTKWFRQSAMP